MTFNDCLQSFRYHPIQQLRCSPISFFPQPRGNASVMTTARRRCLTKNKPTTKVTFSSYQPPPCLKLVIDWKNVFQIPFNRSMKVIIPIAVLRLRNPMCPLEHFKLPATNSALSEAQEQAIHAYTKRLDDRNMSARPPHDNRSCESSTA